MTHVTIEREALKLAKECGATTYTNRHYPEATAVTFSPIAWEKFCEQALAAPVQELGARVDAVVAKIKAGIAEKPTALNSYGLKMWGSVRDDLLALAAAPVQEPVAWSDAKQAEINDWFLSLPAGRQAVLLEDKWMLAGAAFLAGKSTPPAAQPAVQEGRDWSLLEATQESLREHMAEIKRLKAAQPAPVPLTLAKIRTMWGSENGLEECDLCKFDDFVQVVRFIESASGITEKGN